MPKLGSHWLQKYFPDNMLICVMKTNLMHYLSSVYFVSQPLHVSGIFVAHHQEVYCRYTTYVMCGRPTDKPIWTYGILLWGSASPSNIEILPKIPNKVLRTIDNAPWYIPNKLLHTDLQIPTIREEIT